MAPSKAAGQGPRNADSASLRAYLVHQEGVVSLAYSPDSTFLYSAGSDSFIRRFDLASPDDDPEVIDQHKEPVTSLDASLDHLVSASESGEIALFTHAGDAKQMTAFQTFLTRTTLAARCVRFDSSGKRAAVASDELIVKVIDVRDPLRVHLLTGHSKSVRAVSWSPDSTLVATSGCEGAIRIWELPGAKDESSPVCVQVIDDVIVSAEPEALNSVEAAWHPSGKLFVVPSKTNEIAVVSRDSQWKVASTFGSASSARDGAGHSASISTVAFSPNGIYLASADQRGVVLVWDTQTYTAIARLALETETTPTAIRWQPNGNSLAIADHTGQLTRWDGVIDVAHGEPHPANAPRSAGFAEPAARDVGGRLTDRNVEPDGEDLWDGLDDDWMADVDDGETRAHHRHRSLGAQSRRPNGKHASRTVASASTTGVARGQTPFQPGATRGRDRRRYLAFNLIGVVHIVEKDEQENIVTVDFHDEGARKGYNFVDPFKFSLASLGELGVLFASRASPSARAVVRYEAYETWPSSVLGNGSASWQCELPQGEDVVAVAIGGVVDPNAASESRQGLTGSGTVVVATDVGFLRFFTGSGIQKYVWNLGAGVVGLACGQDWLLAVVRGAGDATIGGLQNLRYLLIDLDSFEVVQDGPVPLAAGATAAWCGFSEDGSLPALYDSRGVLSFLQRARRPRQARWVPVLDTQRLRKEGRTDAYWPVGASATQMMCIILKGGEAQPHFPTPLIQEVELEMPLIRMDDAQGALEEGYLRHHMSVERRRDLADVHDVLALSDLGRQELELDKTLLKLVQTACKADNLAQALDFVQLLNQSQSVDAAAKIAGFFRLQDLQERIELVAEARRSGFVPSKARRDEEKRQAKYGHLEDLRTVPDSRVRKAAPNAAAGASSALAKPFAEGPAAAGAAEDRGATGHRPAGGALSKGNVFTKPVPERMSRRDEVSSDPAGEDFELAGRSEDDEAPASEGPRPVEPARLRPTTNPFAKSDSRIDENAATTSSPQSVQHNPFASAKASAAAPAQKAAGLRKSGSFFDRVDNHEKTTAGGAPAVKQPAKQTTLFGFAGAKPDEGSKKGGKKRKQAQDAGPVQTKHKPSSPVDEAAAEADEGVADAVMEDAEPAGDGLSKLAAFRAGA